MKTRFVVGCAAAAVTAAFAIGFGTAPVSRAAASHPAASAPSHFLSPVAATAPRRIGRPPLPTTRRFAPPPVPAEDPGIGEIVNAPDEPPAAAIASRWQDVDRRLDELFGAQFPEGKRTALRAALTGWIRDHARGIRAYYRGNIDQAELTDYIHANLLAYAQSVESTLSRDEYRAFMDLEPGADPYITLVPPGTRVGGPVNGSEAAAANEGDE
jgi:hypothetical protein